MDLVVLLDDEGTPIGTADRETVHSTDTPLHLAFSCYLVDDLGRVLITRRALSKRSWPGVWTNSCCGHPRPGEHMLDAVARRVREELGTEVEGLTEVLPDFRYRAVDASGVIEHEHCPVYIGRLRGDLLPDPDEVAEWAWVENLEQLAAAVELAPYAFSPWLRGQVPQMLDAAAAPLLPPAHNGAAQ